MCENGVNCVEFINTLNIYANGHIIDQSESYTRTLGAGDTTHITENKLITEIRNKKDKNCKKDTLMRYLFFCIIV